MPLSCSGIAVAENDDDDDSILKETANILFLVGTGICYLLHLLSGAYLLDSCCSPGRRKERRLSDTDRETTS